MLNARDLANISDDITELYLKLEFDIKRDMFKRLNRLQKLTDATIYQAEILKEAGGLKTYINDLVKEYNIKSQKMLKDLFNEAMEKAADNDLKYFAAAKKSFSTSQTQKATTAIQRFINADTINKTFARQQDALGKIENDIIRMTLTVADATETEFLKQCNYAYMKISSGAFSYGNTFKDAVDEQARKAYADAAINLADNGVKTILYDYSGTTRRYSIETATRMNILTGINQTASLQTLNNAQELGTDLVEVDAHIGARNVDREGRPWANHEALQGRVYCLYGERDYIDGDGNTQHAPNFYEACGIGEPDGIGGINCRHSFYPYLEGAPLMYSNKELDEYKEKRVELDDDLITPYEAEQRLRICEHNIRQYKAEAQALELTGHTNDPRYIKARNGIYNWQENARHIVNETGIKRKYINEYIGTKSGSQPTGLKPTNTKALKDFEKKPNLKSISQDLASNNVYSLKVGKLEKALTSTAIIEKLAGGDMTGGSCSSLAFSFAANLGGYDVTDYRGGGSRRVFATTSNIVTIAKLKGVESSVKSATDDVKAALDLLKNITENKYYYLATGRHAAIVRKTVKGLYYLEMQSAFENGFKELTENVLRERFKCRKYGRYLDDTILIDCLTLAKNKDFIKLMKYINTNTEAQLKGKRGPIK